MSELTLAACPVVIEWPVQWGDQDTFGHVNNIVFLRWFESARIVYLERIGRRAEIGDDGIGPILAAAHCHYRQQLKYPDRVQIGASVTRVGRSSLTVSHVIVSQQQSRPVADGESVIVYFDYRNSLALPIPEELRQAIDELQQSV